MKKTQNELHKTKYVFLDSSKKSKAYCDYFHVEPQVERHLLGLTNAVSTLIRIVSVASSTFTKMIGSPLANGHT